MVEKIELTLDKESKDLIRSLTSALNNAAGGDKETPKPEPKKGRGRKPKAKPEPEIEESMEDDIEDLEDTEDEGSIDDLEDDTEDEEDMEEEDSDETVNPEQLAQLKKALNTYAGKNGKAKAVKILHKYAKLSQDVKAEDFPKIMKALKV